MKNDSKLEEIRGHATISDVPWLISEIDRLNSGIDSVIYDLRNEDITDPHVVDSITQNLVAVLNGK
ncbi:MULTISPECIES: hypothetical protein [Bacillus]|uniref:Uncharacterized protein n=1 Tax=Bacillus mojavensis TaxID=72360 RepID=A0AAP3CQY4_BACMO|nr:MULTISPECIES: hypothetical protein [Bacillus]KAF1681254.1 hypothetical protein BTW01_03830 [Bacillus sp. SKDU12]MCY7886365.1 hypothetical protein [Bacillus spizizenii]WBL53597.1 hypothetical protein [Bacillus phage yong1]AMA53321.1 hypothetical protein AN935_13960 [Bacillus inaquosorum]AUS10924.1 hypothetical protein C0W65_02115 [Bacillus subtilis]